MFKHIFVGILLLTSSSVFACLFHAKPSDLNTNIPSGSDWTVLRAMEQEQEQQLESIAKLEGSAGFQRATWWLKLLSQELENQGISQTYIYLADVGMWSYYNPSGTTKMSIEVNPKGEFTYLVITQIALSNILSGKISFNEAKEARLVFSGLQHIH